MRAEDEPNVSPNIHHWLSRLEAELKDHKNTLEEVRREVEQVRLKQAEGGRFPVWAAGVILAVATQIGYSVYWSGGINKEVASIAVLQTKQDAAERQIIINTQALTEINRRTAEGTADRFTGANGREMKADLIKFMDQSHERILDRIKAIEERNNDMDENWKVLQSKGLLTNKNK